MLTTVTAFVALVLATAGGPTASAGGCHRVAAPGGSDAGPGTAAHPYRTVQRLADSLLPGMVGCLRGGSYRVPRRGYVLRVLRGGRPGAPVTIRSWHGARARLFGTVVVEHRADHVHLVGLDIEGDGAENTVKVYGARTLIRSSRITNRGRGRSCVILGSEEGGAAREPVLLRNELYECGDKGEGNKDHAIYAAIVRGGRISRNLITDPAAYAIQLYPAAVGMRISRNFIDAGDSLRGGIVVGGSDDERAARNTIDHNVIANARTYGIALGWSGRAGAGNVVRQNCIAGAADGAIQEGPGLEVLANDVLDVSPAPLTRPSRRLVANRDPVGAALRACASLVRGGDPATAPRTRGRPRASG